MNKVITINLGGMAFQLEDAGYDALRAYLDNAKARLEGNPDRDEILSDIETAIADKFRAQLSAHKNVVLAKEVAAVLEQMGPIQDESTAAGGAGSDPGATTANAAGEAEANAGGAPGAGVKRLYRIREGAQISGVCNGIAAYLNVDPTVIRLAFIALTIAWGAGLLVYIVMSVVIPEARTPEEKAAATGIPSTAQEFIRRAREGYYDALKSFPDKAARREWKRKFKRDMREWRANFYREWEVNAEGARQRWRERCAAHPGAALALPLFSLLHGAMLILWICAVVSLLSSGTVFGVALPSGMPVWVAILLLLSIWGIVAWPLKVARRAFYFGGYSTPSAPWALFFVIDAFVWVAVAGTLLWLVMHYFPQAREAVHAIPSVAHEMASSIRDWAHNR